MPVDGRSEVQISPMPVVRVVPRQAAGTKPLASDFPSGAFRVRITAFHRRQISCSLDVFFFN
jgi:hypothetical protein